MCVINVRAHGWDIHLTSPFHQKGGMWERYFLYGWDIKPKVEFEHDWKIVKEFTQTEREKEKILRLTKFLRLTNKSSFDFTMADSWWGCLRSERAVCDDHFIHQRWVHCDLICISSHRLWALVSRFAFHLCRNNTYKIRQSPYLRGINIPAPVWNIRSWQHQLRQQREE